jgi:hypothetical protein
MKRLTDVLFDVFIKLSRYAFVAVFGVDGDLEN